MNGGQKSGLCKFPENALIQHKAYCALLGPNSRPKTTSVTTSSLTIKYLGKNPLGKINSKSYILIQLRI